MKKFFRKLLRFVLRGDQEGKRNHEDFCRLLKRIPESKSLLDVGCAEGRKTLEYAQIASVRPENICGIDIQEKHIKIISGKFTVSIMNLEKDIIPYRDETFDVVTCNQVLEHLKNIFLPLLEMERVLKIGGYLALGIPNLAALHNRILLLFGYQPFCNAILESHVRCFAHKAFLEFLKSNPNFQLIATAGSSLYPLPYPFVEYGARLFPDLSAYTFYILKKVRHNLQTSNWLVNSIGSIYYK